ncbi:hypothetical protein [Streptomyces sp. AC627_RSS907]|uniref:hypothetical protein n=1 Tax=Streptomyces sp. AC627_RSS907 TaxID=2823684 RepID=UPI001C238E8D|nr:hypothetical protein [Streptomyces sp. AC627_RSS907]
MRDVVRRVIADQAPDELPLVDGLSALDDVTAVRRLSGRGQRSEPLGFGVGDIAVLITPVVWLALDQTARRLTDVVVDGAAQRSTTLLRRLFRRNREPATVPPLTRRQLAEVHRTVLDVAGQRGLPAERAEEIADKVVTALTLAEPDTPDDGATPDTPRED